MTETDILIVQIIKMRKIRYTQFTLHLIYYKQHSLRHIGCVTVLINCMQDVIFKLVVPYIT